MDFAGFDWDRGNKEKCQKHRVLIAEIEARFRGIVLVASDPAHSVKKERFKAIGANAEGRKLLVAFALRTRDGETFLKAGERPHHASKGDQSL